MSDSVKNIIKVVAVILAIAVGFALVKKFLVKALEVTDVSAWAGMSEERIESELGFALENDPSMVKLIYAYTEGEVQGLFRRLEMPLNWHPNLQEW